MKNKEKLLIMNNKYSVFVDNNHRGAEVNHLCPFYVPFMSLL